MSELLIVDEPAPSMGTVHGPRPATAAERRAAEARDRRIRAARMMLSENGYLVLDRFRVAELLGGPWCGAFFGAPVPAVNMRGQTVRPASFQ